MAFDPPPCAPGTESCIGSSDRRAPGTRNGDALSLAGPRGSARRLDPADRFLENRPGYGGARLKVPVTALLRISDTRRVLVRGEPLAGTLELHLAWDAESVAIAGEQVPLENEPTAALALTFTGVPVFEVETFGFLGRLSGLMKDRPPLVATTPYRPGMIPVVFVHGTASTSFRWAERYPPHRILAGTPTSATGSSSGFQTTRKSDSPVPLRLREALAGGGARIPGQGPALSKGAVGHRRGGCWFQMKSTTEAISSGTRHGNRS